MRPARFRLSSTRSPALTSTSRTTPSGASASRAMASAPIGSPRFVQRVEERNQSIARPRQAGGRGDLKADPLAEPDAFRRPRYPAVATIATEGFGEFREADAHRAQHAR